MIRDEGWGSIVDGAAELETGPAGVLPHRLPAWARAQVDDLLFSFAESCPTGVVLRFDTPATSARLTVGTTTAAAVGAPAERHVFVVRRGGRQAEVTGPEPTVIRLGPDNALAGVDTRPPAVIDLPLPGDGPVEVFLPHNARVDLVELSADAELSPVRPTGLRWTHYGSSISQGMNAATALGTWPVSAATELGWRLRNLSFSGSAQLDGFVARIIRDTPADLITLKVGINLLNADSMRERTFRPAVHAFLDTIREGQPHTPIVLISAISCPIHEDSPGPVIVGEDGIARTARRDVEQDAGALTLSRTREILADAASVRADPSLRLIDGRTLFGPEDVALLYDRLHPDREGLALIASRFVDSARSGPIGDALGRNTN